MSSPSHAVTSENAAIENASKLGPLLIKSMFRRSRALYELGNYYKAAMDANECLIQEPTNELFKIHMEKVGLSLIKPTLIKKKNTST